MNQRRLRTGLSLIGVLCAAAALGPVLSPYDPDRGLGLALQNSGPSFHHLLGTDFFSRDVLTRMLFGARISLSIAFLSVLVSVTIGTAVGLTAGFAGGIADTLLMRLVDVGLAIPRIFLLLVVVALWQGSGVTVPLLVLMLGLTSWFETSRLVRAQVLTIKAREFIVAAEALGVAPADAIVRHILPNVQAPILVSATLGVGNMILIEAGLSYLGLGVTQPTSSLGKMIAEGKDSFFSAPSNVIAPAVFLILTVLAFAMLSDALEDQAGPRIVR